MKKIPIKILILTLALFTTLLVLISCNNSEKNPESENTVSEQPTAVPSDTSADIPEVIEGNEMMIFRDGAYTCNIICSDRATEVEKEVYNKLRNDLKALTGVMPAFTTDFVSYNDNGSARKLPAILIGETNYVESNEAYASLCYGSGSINLIGNKLVFAFSSVEEGASLCAQFSNLIKNSSDQEIFADISGLPFNAVVNQAIANIPLLPYKSAESVDCGDDTHLVRISKVGAEDFANYKQILTEEGYSLVNTREAAGHLYATFVRDDIYVYTYYKPNSQTIRVITGPKEHLPNTDTESEKIALPSLTLLGQSYSDIGLGMVYRLPNGQFVVFDGGADYSKDFVYKAIKAEAVTEEISIAAWFLSHSHGDHYGAFVDFVENHIDEISIETVVFNFATEDRYAEIDGEETNKSMNTIREILATTLADTKIIKAHTGQVLEFGGIPFEVLYTCEDFYPSSFQYLNDTSLVVRAFVEGKSILMLADATYTVGAVLIEAYRDYLKSDIVQLAHHGIWASIDKLYTYIDADVLIWPSNASNAKKWITDGAVRAAIAPVTDIYLPGPSSVKIEFPYVFKNNKAEFIAQHT